MPKNKNGSKRSKTKFERQKQMASILRGVREVGSELVDTARVAMSAGPKASRAVGVSKIADGIGAMKTAKNNRQKITAGVEIGAGALLTMFNDAWWYGYKGELSLPDINATRPMDPQSLTNLTKNGMAMGVPHASQVNIEINNLEGNSAYRQAIVEAYLDIRTGLRSNLPYDEDSFRYFIDAAYHLGIMAKTYERLMGWRNTVSATAPEIQEVFWSVPENPYETGVVSTRYINWLKDGDLYAKEVENIKFLNAKLNLIPVPLKYMEYASYYVGGTFLDELSPNPIVTNFVPRVLPMPVLRKRDARDTSDIIIDHVEYYDISDVNSTLISTCAQNIIETCGVMIADATKFSGYGTIKLVDPDDYTTNTIIDKEQFMSIENAYTIDNDTYGDVLKTNPNYIRVDAYDKFDEKFLPAIVNMGAITREADTMFNVISQCAFVSSENVEFNEDVTYHGGITASISANVVEEQKVLAIQFNTLCDSSVEFVTSDVDEETTTSIYRPISEAQAKTLATETVKSVTIHRDGSLYQARAEALNSFNLNYVGDGYCVFTKQMFGTYTDDANRRLGIFPAARVRINGTLNSIQFIRWDLISCFINEYGVLTEALYGASGSLAIITNSMKHENAAPTNDVSDLHFSKTDFGTYTVITMDMGTFNFECSGSPDLTEGQKMILFSTTQPTNTGSLNALFYTTVSNTVVASVNTKNAFGLINWWTSALDHHIPVIIRPRYRSKVSYTGQDFELSGNAVLIKTVRTPALVSIDSIQTSQKWSLLGFFSPGMKKESYSK